MIALTRRQVYCRLSWFKRKSLGPKCSKQSVPSPKQYTQRSTKVSSTCRPPTPVADLAVNVITQPSINDSYSRSSEAPTSGKMSPYMTSSFSDNSPGAGRTSGKCLRNSAEVGVAEAEFGAANTHYSPGGCAGLRSVRTCLS